MFQKPLRGKYDYEGPEKIKLFFDRQWPEMCKWSQFAFAGTQGMFKINRIADKPGKKFAGIIKIEKEKKEDENIDKKLDELLNI